MAESYMLTDADLAARDVRVRAQVADELLGDDFVQWFAVRLLGEYDQEFDAAHLSWQDFAVTARDHLGAIGDQIRAPSGTVGNPQP